MATFQSNTPLDHTTDSGFRLWGAAFRDALLACGLVKTADTGQINWTTVTRPSPGQPGGYEIWRFNDTLQATKPVFIKIEPGTGGFSATGPGIWVTIGTATNSAGNLTGFVSARYAVASSGAPISTTIDLRSNFCHKDGFLGVEFKRNSQIVDKSQFMFLLSRTVDDSGAWTGEGVHFIYGQGTNSYNNAISMNFNTNLVDVKQNSSQSYFGYSFEQSSTTSLVGLTPQVYKHFHTMPLVKTNIGSCAILKSESTPDNTSTFKLVGNTARTYIVLGHKNAMSNVDLSYYMMLWE